MRRHSALPASIPFLVIALGLSACAGITTPSNGAAVPPGQVFDARLATPQAGHGKLVVTRGEGMAIAGCATRVLVDTRPVAELWPAQRVELFLPPGQYTVAAHPGPSCGGRLIEQAVKVQAGSQLGFKASGGGAFTFLPEPL